MSLRNRHTLGASLLAIAALAFLGPAQSQPQPAATKPGAGKLDSQLTPGGKSLESKLVQARESTAGRVPKEAWAKQLGNGHPAYKNAKTHLPHGVATAVPVGAAEEAAARNAASQYSLSRAKAALQAQGKAATGAAAQKLLDDRNREVAAINVALAGRRGAFAQYDKSGDQVSHDLLLRQVLYERAEQAKRGTLPAKPQPMTAAEKEEATRRYYTFLNREAAAPTTRGGRR
jgi:hypothetical protein